MQEIGKYQIIAARNRYILDNLDSLVEKTLKTDVTLAVTRWQTENNILAPQTITSDELHEKLMETAFQNHKHMFRRGFADAESLRAFLKEKHPLTSVSLRSMYSVLKSTKFQGYGDLYTYFEKVHGVPSEKLQSLRESVELRKAVIVNRGPKQKTRLKNPAETLNTLRGLTEPR